MKQHRKKSASVITNYSSKRLPFFQSRPVLLVLLEKFEFVKYCAVLIIPPGVGSRASKSDGKEEIMGKDNGIRERVFGNLIFERPALGFTLERTNVLTIFSSWEFIQLSLTRSGVLLFI